MKFTSATEKAKILSCYQHWVSYTVKSEEKIIKTTDLKREKTKFPLKTKF